MKRPLVAIVLCLLISLMPLAGCVSEADIDSVVADHDADIAEKESTIENLTVEVSDLENQILTGEIFVSTLQSELSNVSGEYNSTLVAYYALQSEHASVEIQLSSAEYNASAHETQIASLQNQLYLANSHITMLNDLMSNTSNTTNESFAQMSNQMSQMNEHISNLSALLNYSTARHQENVTLVSDLITQQSELNTELSNVTSLLSEANSTINELQQEIIQLNADNEIYNQSYILGILNGSERVSKIQYLESISLDPTHYGTPTITIENHGFETYMNYSTSVNRDHSLWFELCNAGGNPDLWFPMALGFNSTNSYNTSSMTMYVRNSTYLNDVTYDMGPNGFEADGNTWSCLVWNLAANSNGTTNFVFPNFDLLTANRNVWTSNPLELRVFACMRSGIDICSSESNWIEHGSGDWEENYSMYSHETYGGDFLHPVETGFAVEVEILDNSCLMNTTNSEQTGCPPPDCISAFDDGGNSPCSVHILDWGTGSGTYNYQFYNLTYLYAEFSTGSSTHNIYVCDGNFHADVRMSTGSNNVRIYSYGWGPGNNVTIDSSFNTGTLNGNGNRSVDYNLSLIHI